jgi:hypothetical protein
MVWLKQKYLQFDLTAALVHAGRNRGPPIPGPAGGSRALLLEDPGPCSRILGTTGGSRALLEDPGHCWRIPGPAEGSQALLEDPWHCQV